VTRFALTGGLFLAEDAAGFRPGTLHCADGVIVAFDQEPAGGDEAEIALGGQYVLPGLIDSHYHLVSRSAEIVDDRLVAQSMLEAVINAEDCIASGVTTVRDCGARHEGIYALQAAIAAGAIVGPEAFTAGQNPTGDAAPRHWRNVFAQGPEAIRAAVRGQVEAGAQWIKVILAHAFDPFDWAAVTPFMDDAEIAAAVDEAHRLGVQIGAHCEGWEVAERGIDLGLDSLDHAPLLSDRAVAGLKDRDLTYTPTVWAFGADAGIDVSALPTERQVQLTHWQDEHRASVRRALAAGVRITAGSDAHAAVTGPGVLLNEMKALLGCGLSTAQVLAAATVNGAELLGQGKQLGVLRPGARADLIGLDGDPFTSLEELRRPAWVRKDGELRYERGRGAIPATDRRGDGAVVARWV
jgi:imidazolonepropionase-like amidohydrolase